MKIKQFNSMRWFVTFVLCFMLVFNMGAIIKTNVFASTIPPLVDECDGNAGADVVADIWGYRISTGDVGFGEDSCYATTKNADPHVHGAFGGGENACAYVQYNVGGRNLITVETVVAPESKNNIPPVYIVGESGKVLEVNNTIEEASSNWPKVTYKYIVEPTEKYVRVCIATYDHPEEKFFNWSQQITKIVLEYTDTLPEADKAPAHYFDIMNGNAVNGQRADVYNIAVRTDKLTATGDVDRIVYGTNPGAQEAYVDYLIENQDTVMVTGYEPILEDNKRPENVTAVKFCHFDVNWDVPATREEVILGDFASGVWTKVRYFYEFEGAVNARLRLMINKPAEGQAEVELGRVDIFNSKFTDIKKVNGKIDIEEYAIKKDKSAYSDKGWDEITNVVLDAKTAIDNAESGNVEAVLTEAKGRIDAVKTLIDELQEKKEAIVKQVNDHLATKVQADYSEENWIILTTLANDAITDINATEDIEVANQILEDVKQDMDNVVTKAQELKAYKDQVVSSINEYKATKVQSEYSEANWNTINSLVETAITAVNNAENGESADAILEQLKKDVESVEKLKAEPDSESQDRPEGSSSETMASTGCSSSVGGSALMAFVVLGLVTVLKKRKN